MTKKSPQTIAELREKIASLQNARTRSAARLAEVRQVMIDLIGLVEQNKREYENQYWWCVRELWNYVRENKDSLSADLAYKEITRLVDTVMAGETARHRATMSKLAESESLVKRLRKDLEGKAAAKQKEKLPIAILALEAMEADDAKEQLNANI